MVMALCSYRFAEFLLKKEGPSPGLAIRLADVVVMVVSVVVIVVIVVVMVVGTLT